jgi:hypothetical protein
MMSRVDVAIEHTNTTEKSHQHILTSARLENATDVLLRRLSCTFAERVTVPGIRAEIGLRHRQRFGTLALRRGFDTYRCYI